MENKRFVITVTIQSNKPGSTPVDVTWYRGENRAEALAALVRAGAKDIYDKFEPEHMRAVVKAVRMDIYDLSVEREPKCSGDRESRDGYQSVPYCRNNPGGCALHYPSEQVSGNGATDSTPPPEGNKRNTILTETEHGTFYTGPLEPAKQAMLDEYGDSITIHYNDENGVWVVAEHRGSPAGDLNPNQWGSGRTEEEAWRYLIGTDFGPLDATYDDEGYEAHQRKMLGLSPLRGEG